MSKNLKPLSIAVLLAGLLTNCQNEMHVVQKTDNNPLEIVNSPLRELQLKVMVEVLSLAKEQQFRQFVLEECLKQKHGDYNVYIRDIIAKYKDQEEYKAPMQRLEALIRQIRPLVHYNEPLIFYPRAETIEESMVENSTARVSEVVTTEPLAVLQADAITAGADAGGRTSSDYFPDTPPLALNGYMIQSPYSGVWFFVQKVDEEYAWENDIYVIGTDENVEQNSARVNGGAEYGGIIQVTDLNSIEHWTSGKLEFKVIICSANNVEISNRDFGKLKRKNFRNQVWHEIGHSVGNWNPINWGNYTIENWWERDGGGTSSTTVSVPSSNGLPALSYTVNHGSDDNNFGLSMVQFTDPATQVYQISFMNFKRRF
ncbi:hypothetical protein DYBT9275_00723 [Dyadobacter sp. CECT 9275]|uniref:Uncharacterized protein n=1 Tax=Dyadobacter helix TaxID=2822344 RepID=A0A916J800_9BACT|nr:hypothetical protein [Dyadobacter sp. CECT 9275]CAG4991306.1 hypothetical protein DYBT9275_00723 [Dyadobacter sp. CECT 9275]